MNKLINISEATSIAIHSLAIIYRRKDMVNAQLLADLTGFSKNHISKVLQVLVKQGYIVSLRGPKGGFKNLETTGEISLLAVYELFDGQINGEFCRSHKEICPFSDCDISEIINDLSKTFIEKFNNLKIKDLKFKF